LLHLRDISDKTGFVALDHNLFLLFVVMILSPFLVVLEAVLAYISGMAVHRDTSHSLGRLLAAANVAIAPDFHVIRLFSLLW
jgi:hypothetical protein